MHTIALTKALVSDDRASDEIRAHIWRQAVWDSAVLSVGWGR
jgi:hypothetical protein